MLRDTGPPGGDADTARGWYADPLGSPNLRYWDGKTWTVQIAGAPRPQPGHTTGTWNWLIGRLPWFAALVALAAVITLMVVQLIKNDGGADSTTLGFLGLATVFLFAVMAPHQTSGALRRITSFKVAGIEVGLGEIKRAERVKPLPGEDDGVGGERPKTNDYAAVVDRLQSRLRFVRLILGLKEEMGEQDYLPIADRLRTDLLLTRDEESFVLDLLEGPELAMTDWSAATREAFLDSAWAFATRFGPLIWDRHVRKRLEDAGWFVADYRQQRGHRPDFLAYREQDWAVMAARVGGNEENPYHYAKTAGRLVRFKPQEPISGRCIVIPDIRAGTLEEKYRKGSDRQDGVKVVKLGRLEKDWRRAFDENDDAEEPQNS